MKAVSVCGLELSSCFIRCEDFSPLKGQQFFFLGFQLDPLLDGDCLCLHLGQAHIRTHLSMRAVSWAASVLEWSIVTLWSHTHGWTAFVAGAANKISVLLLRLYCVWFQGFWDCAAGDGCGCCVSDRTTLRFSIRQKEKCLLVLNKRLWLSNCESVIRRLVFFSGLSHILLFFSFFSFLVSY